MSYRMHPLYQLARELSSQEIVWDNLQLAKLQHEMRVDYVEQMPTPDLIQTVVAPDDSRSWMDTLYDIRTQSEQGSFYDAALGQGRC